jgi:murein DD-endopeptidase MepM/ murein hydrolase activator NlpD
MMNAYDASQSPPRLGECPVATSREPGLGPVDHIYVSKDVTVSGYTMIEGRDKTGSDHPVIYIDTGTANQTASGLGRFVGVGDDSIVKLLTLRESEFVGVIRLNISDVLVQSGDWVFPLAKGTYNISSPYGPRNLNGDDFHNGADYGTNGVEAPLVAMHRGTVLRAQYDDAWGNYLMVETNIPVEGVPGATYKYMYAHLSRYELGLTLGQKLEAGDPVGNVGDTGNSFGEHLHLNICTSLDCLNGDPEGTVNPADFLRSVRITP